MNARYDTGPRFSLFNFARIAAVILVVGFFVVRGLYAGDSTRDESRQGWVTALQAELGEGGADRRGPVAKRPQPRAAARSLKAK